MELDCTSNFTENLTIFSAESQAAIARLRKADDERFSLIDELRESREETKSIQSTFTFIWQNPFGKIYSLGELETIKRSYEEQLETMTEELAQQLNAVNTSTSNVVEEEKTTKKSRFSLFGRGT